MSAPVSATNQNPAAVTAPANDPVQLKPLLKEKPLDPMLATGQNTSQKFGKYDSQQFFAIPDQNAETAGTSAPAGYSWTTSDDSLFGSAGKPSSAQVHEGVNGDCPFDSPLAAVADARPVLIRHNIQQVDAHHYDVTLYTHGADGTAQPQKIRVNDDFLQKDGQSLGLSSGSDVGNSKWAALYEKAFAIQTSQANGQSQASYNAIDDHISGTAGSSTNSSQAGAQRANAPDALFALTGQPANLTDISTTTDPQQVQSLLAPANGQQAPVVANTSKAHRDLGIMGPHNYQVVGTTPAQGSTPATVTVRDPHGGNYTGQNPDPSAQPTDGHTVAKGDGQVTMTLHDFMSAFTRVTVGGYPPASSGP